MLFSFVLVILLSLTALAHDGVTNKKYYLGKTGFCKEDVQDTNKHPTKKCDPLFRRSTDEVTWFEAKAHCMADNIAQGKGARLARVSTPEEQSQIENFLSHNAPANASKFWIGGSYEMLAKDYVWTGQLLFDYDKMNYTHWAPDTNLVNKDRLIEMANSVFIDKEGYWHKASKNDKMPAFICECPSC